MPCCPNCGHKFTASTRATDVELQLKMLQRRLNEHSLVINLKREICRHFKVKKFADLPLELNPAALMFAEEKTEFYTAIWGARKVLEEAIPIFLTETMGCGNYELSKNIYKSLIAKRRDRYWADLTPEQALEAIREEVGSKNIWEFAYGGTG